MKFQTKKKTKKCI